MSASPVLSPNRPVRCPICGTERLQRRSARDPIDRLRSMYTFFQRGTPSDDPLSRFAHESDLRGFFLELIEKHPHIANNPQVNMLATEGAYTRPPGPADLARATETMLDVALN